jgi:hypothetical protein
MLKVVNHADMTSCPPKNLCSRSTSDTFRYPPTLALTTTTTEAIRVTLLCYLDEFNHDGSLHTPTVSGLLALRSEPLRIDISFCE